MKKYELPEDLSSWIEKYLNRYQHSLKEPQALAKSILTVSDNFQNPHSTTPWKDPKHWAAYLGYFFPLNYLRSLKIIDEAQQWNFFDDVEEVVDFGCGPGTFSKALVADSRLNINKFTGCDSEDRLGALFLDTSRERQELRFQKKAVENPAKNALLVASYVINELEEIPQWIFNYDKIMVAEPSTKQAFPKLLQLRDQLIDHNFSILAPCPHHNICPLSESKKDWCHDRLHWNQPEWFQALEAQLPIKNKTLTYSYLIASKETQKESQFWRVVGDPLIEKGKTRWLICRNEKRQFLSHLKRQGKAPDLHRGDKFKLENFEEKANEIRFEKSDLSIIN